MANWIFTTPVVREAPFAWNPLMERFSLNRAISIVETSPGVYQQTRYDSYTNELGAKNLPRVYTDPYPQPSLGLNYFRGGYEWVVDDATKASIIASNVGVDASNFVPVGGGVPVESVNGYLGPNVVLTYADVEAAKKPVIRTGYVTSGNITPPATGGVWTPIDGLEFPIPAVVGDYVELYCSFMYQPNAGTFIDYGVINGITIVRYASTGTGTPGFEGDPAMYAAPGTYRTASPIMGFTVTSGDLDGTNVRFGIMNSGAGDTATIYASSQYPLRYVVKNLGPVD
jgi:hypothetical protein